VRSRVELFEQIRRDRRVEQLSIRELADRHGVHRRTVRQALASAVPPPRKTYPPRRRPAIDPYVTVIDGWLIEDRDAPRKQRHTARRVWQRFVAEHEVTLAEVTVSRYVARRRGELGLDHREVSIPQMHLADAEAEVDFGEFYATVAGVVIKVWMFVMRLSHSGKAFDVAFGTQAQEAFLEGHVLAFEHFGGVPARVRYDNLKPAVVRVLKGRDRTESERFTALRSHYGFDSFFCRPGIEGAHEKGGVEGEIGRFCRRHLVPVPKVDSLAALNERIAAGDVHDDGRVITGRPVTIAAAFAAEAPTLMPLPVEAFDPARQLETRGDNRARVSVRQCFYSVPARFAGRRLPIRLAARCLDELGYVQIDPRGAELLFQIITEREERASIAIATNLPFSEWGERVPRPSARRRDRRPRHLQRPHPRDRDRVLPATHQQDCRSRQERSPAKLRRPPSPARPDLNPHGDELALQIPQNPHRLGVVETRRDRPLHA
jgi:transposase